MTCPRCAQPLTTHKTATATLQGCLTCGGVFLDRDSRARVVAARCDDTARASELAASHARWSPDLRARCPCPICRAPMQVVQVAGGIDLDVCDTHGAWFDRDELRRFIAALRSPRSQKKRKAAAVAATAAVAVVATDDSKVETALEVADAGFSVLEIFGEVLGAIDF